MCQRGSAPPESGAVKPKQTQSASILAMNTPPSPDSTARAVPSPPWWRSAVIYQVYIRSFADGDGDGVGDITGLRERLPYLSRLGVDAIWINPWYPSPMKDAGYDVSDFRDVDPVFGTLADAETMIAEAHAHGIRVLLDLVPNHVSDQHEWFQAGPGGAARLARARTLHLSRRRRA